MRCGATLGRRGGGAERKIVTVLHCAPSGASLGEVEDEARALVAHYGGTVERPPDGGVVGIFGVPTAHEDDPERAVRAALRILDAVAAQPEGAEDPVHVRIGVATGESLVGPDGRIDAIAPGGVLRQAARLQWAAGPDAILVSEPTYRATAHAIVYGDHADVAVDVGVEPTGAWRVVRARSRPGVDLRERPATPFVGRTAETALLRQLFRLATRAADASGRADRSVPVVLVTGEAGVGKTRLLREFSTYLDELPELVRWRVGRCLPYGEGVRFWALSEIVKAEAGILDTDDDAVADAKLDDAIEALRIPEDERDWMRVLLGPLAGLPPPTHSPPRHELFAAWRSFIAALAADAPTVLVLEDLHWADEALLAFVTSLAMRVEGAPLLVIGVARPELMDRHPDWDAPLPNLTRIELPPLDADESRGLLGALLDGVDLPKPTEAALLERAGGNPLFAEEFVRMLRDRNDDAALGRGAIPVPSSLEALVSARLDALPPGLKPLVQDASVLGKLFWPGGLAAVADVEREDVEARLPFLLRRELVRKLDASTIPGEPEFTFRHDVIREVAYGRIPAPARAERHRRAAGWLRGLSANAPREASEAIAHHLSTALELGEDDPELRAEAGHALVEAAGRVAPLDATGAGAYLDRALDLLAPGDPVRLDGLAAAAAVAGSSGRLADEERRWREAIEAARAAGETLRVGDLTAMLARSLVLQGRMAEADELFDVAVRTLEALPPGPELARLYARVAGQRFLEGDHEAARSWAERALEVARDDEPADAVILALQYRGSARAELGDPQGLEDMRSAVRLAKQANLTEEAGVGMTNLAYLVWMREGPAASLEIALENESFSAQRGFLHNVMWAKAAQLEALFDLGTWDRLIEVADEVIAWDSPDGRVGSTVGAWARVAEAWVLARRGDLDRAAALVQEVEGASQLMENTEFFATALSLRGWIAWCRGDLAEARAHLDDFAKATADAPEVRVHFLPIAARILADAGDVEAAEALLPPGPDPPVARRRLSAETARAVIAEARGDLRRAADRYAAAANGWEAFGFVLERGQCLLGRGRSLLRLGQRKEARAALRAAREVLEPLGPRSTLDEIDALLAERR
jgi:tetratricopeptide (TPR) repeat protein